MPTTWVLMASTQFELQVGSRADLPFIHHMPRTVLKSRTVLKTPSLELFKQPVDLVHRDMV